MFASIYLPKDWKGWGQDTLALAAAPNSTFTIIYLPKDRKGGKCVLAAAPSPATHRGEIPWPGKLAPNHGTIENSDLKSYLSIFNIRFAVITAFTYFSLYTKVLGPK